MTAPERTLPRILVCGPNPAWQKTLSFDEFRPYEVNRARECDLRASGKGINFARAARTWGLAHPVVCQFSGGANGRALTNRLKDEGIEFIGREIAGSTRCCTTVLCGKSASMTELIEPSPTVSADDIASLRDSIIGLLDGADALALCGTLPEGPIEGFYPEIAVAAVRAGKPVLMDSVKQFRETLSAGVPYLKINSGELLSLTGASDPEAAALELLKQFPLQCAAITDGPARAFIAWRGRIHRISIPDLPGIRNPLGAGDVCSGVMLSELVAGFDPLKAFSAGLAAACASCLTRYAADFDRAEALRILGGMRVGTAGSAPD